MDALPASYYATAFTVGVLLTVGFVLALVLVVRATDLRWVCVAVGAGTFVVSQLVIRLPLISLLSLVLSDWILHHPWLWVIVLALSAGLVEEIARALGFGLLLSRRPDRLTTPVAAGLGHGGTEAVVLVGLSQLTSAVTLLVLQSGVAGPAPVALQAQRDALEVIGPLGQLAGLYERFSVLALHLALSVLVFAAVRDRRWVLLLLSVALHTFVNAAAGGSVLLLGAASAGPIWATELIITVAVLLAVLIVHVSTRSRWVPT